MGKFDFILLGVFIALVLYLRRRSKKGIALEKQRKIIFRRILARYIDGFSYGIIFIPISYLLSQMISINENTYPIVFIVPVIFLIYEVIATKIYGQTLGKYLTQVSVIDNATGVKVSWKQSVLRNLYFVFVIVLLTAYMLSNPSVFVPIVLKKADHPPMGIEEAKTFLSLMFVCGILVLADFLVARFSKERRSIRDFISGTAVTFKA